MMCLTSVGGLKRFGQRLGIESDNDIVANDSDRHGAIAQRQQVIVGAVVLVDNANCERLAVA
jgi:hypothetical protein